MSAPMKEKNMDNCPSCGALLEASLVRRIRNPEAEESCPWAAREVDSAPPRKRERNLLGLMVLGSLIRG